MKMNRMGSMTIFNRKPTKEPEVVENVHDDSDEEAEKKPMQIVREIPMDKDTLEEVKNWYERSYNRHSIKCSRNNYDHPVFYVLTDMIR